MILPLKLLRRYSSYTIITCLLLYCSFRIIGKIIQRHGYSATVNDYVINTIGCRVMTMSPFNPTVLKFWHNIEKEACNAKELFEGITEGRENFLVMNANVTLSFYKESDIMKMKCVYIVGARSSNSHGTIDQVFKPHLNMKLKIEPDHLDIVHVRCTFHGTTIYNKVHFFIIPPENSRNLQRNWLYVKPFRLSVMVVGIDSLSHMHFLRSMPRTAQYMKNRTHVEFWGYNRVGANSFDNLFPLLTGKSSIELSTCVFAGNIEKCNLIWNEYKLNGYLTSLGGDTIDMGIFTNETGHLSAQPTAYYLTPAMKLMWRYTHRNRKRAEPCNGADSYADTLWKFVEKLMPLMEVKEFFSFFWWMQGVHNDFNYAKLLDSRFLKMMQLLEQRGILDNSLVFFLSNSGINSGGFRQTYQGMLEENQPLLIASYPEWLKDKYPLAARNFQRNSRKLVTAYDLHETFKHLIVPDKLNNDWITHHSLKLQKLGSNIPRSISLFLPIPSERDCDMADIQTNYCECHMLQEVSVNLDNVMLAAQTLVDGINALLKQHTQCNTLKLHRALKAYTWDHQGDDIEYEIKVQVQTMPGLGEYEGVIHFTAMSMAVDGSILRINDYNRSQMGCKTNKLVEMYCDCKKINKHA